MYGILAVIGWAFALACASFAAGFKVGRSQSHNEKQL
jgi:hypothetical protein